MELENGADNKFWYRYRAFVTTPAPQPTHTRLAEKLGDLIPLSFSPSGAKVLALRLITGDVIGCYELLAVNVTTGAAVQLNRTRVHLEEGGRMRAIDWR
jgi:hypothetical protein